MSFQCVPQLPASLYVGRHLVRPQPFRAHQSCCVCRGAVYGGIAICFSSTASSQRMYGIGNRVGFCDKRGGVCPHLCRCDAVQLTTSGRCDNLASVLLGVTFQNTFPVLEPACFPRNARGAAAHEHGEQARAGILSSLSLE